MGDLGGFIGTFPEVLIDPWGTVHLVYADGLNGQLKHVQRISGQWQIEVVDTIGGQSQYGSQAGALAAEVDRVGGIGVAYWDADDSQIKYAYMVPEPATLLLVLAGAGMLPKRRRTGE